jgi:hypothetical protein
MNKPIPNFKKFGLKSGEVPKFFDNVLVKRAGDSVDTKAKWWADRKKEVEGIAAESEAVSGSTSVASCCARSASSIRPIRGIL